MGDSIVTEVLARYSRNLWPEPLDFHSNGGFFDSVVFTNGGMRMQFADLRITQKVLLTSSGPWFNNLIMCIVRRGTWCVAWCGVVWRGVAWWTPRA